MLVVRDQDDTIICRNACDLGRGLADRAIGGDHDDNAHAPLLLYR
jgi:hypothetical protein